MGGVPLYPERSGANGPRWARPGRIPHSEESAGGGVPFRSFRFFELPTEEDTGNCFVKRPCFLSDRIGRGLGQARLGMEDAGIFFGGQDPGSRL